MKFLMKYTAVAALLLCALCAEAQSFTKMHSDALVSDKVLQAPSYQQSNSLLDRKISVHATPSVGSFRQTESGYTGSGIHTSTGVSARGGVINRQSSTRGDLKTFSGVNSSTFGSKLSGIGATTVGGPVVRDESKGGSLDLGTEDLQPGQLVPMGNATLPLLLLLLAYAAFIAVRKARKEA